MSDKVEYKVDYMIAVHRAPDDWPEEQDFTVVQGCINKQYDDYLGHEDRMVVMKSIAHDIKKEFIDKVNKEH